MLDTSKSSASSFGSFSGSPIPPNGFGNLNKPLNSPTNKPSLSASFSSIMKTLKQMPPSMVAGLLVFTLVIIGGIAGFILTMTGQDLRQQADVYDIVACCESGATIFVTQDVCLNQIGGTVGACVASGGTACAGGTPNGATSCLTQESYVQCENGTFSAERDCPTGFKCQQDGNTGICIEAPGTGGTACDAYSGVWNLWECDQPFSGGGCQDRLVGTAKDPASFLAGTPTCKVRQADCIGTTTLRESRWGDTNSTCSGTATPPPTVAPLPGCYQACTLAVGCADPNHSCLSGLCRHTDNPDSPTCEPGTGGTNPTPTPTPTSNPTPTPTPVPTPTPTPIYECNSSCTNDAQCESVNPAYTCYGETSTTPGNCRMENNPNSTTCELPELVRCVDAPDTINFETMNGATTVMNTVVTDQYAANGVTFGVETAPNATAACAARIQIGNYAGEADAWGYPNNTTNNQDKVNLTYHPTTETGQYFISFAKLNGSAFSGAADVALMHNCVLVINYLNPTLEAAGYTVDNEVGETLRVVAYNAAGQQVGEPQYTGVTGNGGDGRMALFNFSVTDETNPISQIKIFFDSTTGGNYGFDNFSAYCQDEPTPTPTPSPTPTPTPIYECNSSCTTDAQCEGVNPDYYCHGTDGTTPGNCRMETNPESTTCAPPIGPQCLSLSLNNVSNPTAGTADPKIGDALTFTCGTVQGADHYIFRVIEPNNNIVNLQATGATSAQYTVTKSGAFQVQCQICTGPDVSTCHEYEAVN